MTSFKMLLCLFFLHLIKYSQRNVNVYDYFFFSLIFFLIFVLCIFVLLLLQCLTLKIFIFVSFKKIKGHTQTQVHFLKIISLNRKITPLYYYIIFKSFHSVLYLTHRRSVTIISMAEQFPDFSASVPLLMLFLYLESCTHRCPSSLPPLALITMLIFSRPPDFSRSFQMPPLLRGVFCSLSLCRTQIDCQLLDTALWSWYTGIIIPLPDIPLPELEDSLSHGINTDILYQVGSQHTLADLILQLKHTHTHTHQRCHLVAHRMLVAEWEQNSGLWALNFILMNLHKYGLKTWDLC